MKNHLGGIIPAMVTPIDEQERVDEKTLRQLVNYLIAGGVHGLFPVGSQGEFYAFTPEEKRQIWEIVVDETRGRIPVYAGTGAITTQQVIELNRYAEASGVDAVSVMTPYFIKPTDIELYDHYSAIADATSLPIILYNNPGRTGVKLSPNLVSRLAQNPNIIGIKDSGGDLTTTIDYLQQTTSEFSVLMGRDSLIYAGLIHGCKGSIAATANVVPKLVVDIYSSFIEGDMDKALETQEKLFPLRMAFDLGTFPVVIKEAMELIGLPVGPAKRPLHPLSEDARKKLRIVLKDMSIIEEKA